MDWSWEGEILLLNGRRVALAEIIRIREGKRWFAWPAFLGTIVFAIFVGFAIGPWYGLLVGLVVLVLAWKVVDSLRPFLLHVFLESDEVITVAGQMDPIDALRDSIMLAKKGAKPS